MGEPESTTPGNSGSDERDENSIHGFEYGIENTQDGVERPIEGKAEDRRSVRREFEAAVAGRDSNIGLDVDYDVRGGLVIEPLDSDQEVAEWIQQETERESAAN